MKKDNQKSLDLFKERTLGCLAAKNETQRTYPITKGNLIYIKKCPICGSGKTTTIAEVYLKNKLNFFTTNVCENCLFVFRSISPSLKWFKKCWKKIETDSLEVFNPEIEAIRKIRYERYFRMLSKHVSHGKVLDIGAGYGTGSRVFSDHGYSIEALEPENNKAQYIKKVLLIPTHENNIESFLSTKPKKRYDLIIFAHCLEHLDNPSGILSQLKKLLNPGGILYVEVPVLWNYVTWSDAMYLTHKSNFAEEHLMRFVKNNGFIIKEKFHIRHSPKETFDFGLVLKANSDSPTRSKINSIAKKHNVNDALGLYRRNMPLADIPTLDQKLVYSVSCIEQFYCTLKLGNYTLAEEDNVLIFNPK